jgi:hypothetical protein
VVKWLEQAFRLPPNDVLFEKYFVTIQIVKNARMRRLCSGKTLAFQAKDAGSIPARRSNYTLFPFGWDWLMFGRLCRFMVKNGGLILHFKHHHIIEFIEKGAKGDA